MILPRGEPVEARMRAVVIVVVAPCRNHAAGMAQRREQVLVEAFLTHPTVEALDQAVLHGFPGCDVVPLDFAVFLPFEHRVGRQFGAVVRHHHAGIATQLSDPVQLAGDTRRSRPCAATPLSPAQL